MFVNVFRVVQTHDCEGGGYGYFTTVYRSAEYSFLVVFWYIKLLQMTNSCTFFKDHELQLYGVTLILFSMSVK